MASAGNKNTGITMQTKPVEVSQQLQDGEKFIKWDEVYIFNAIHGLNRFKR